jgi:hypothetical protein
VVSAAKMAMVGRVKCIVLCGLWGGDEGWRKVFGMVLDEGVLRDNEGSLYTFLHSSMI